MEGNQIFLRSQERHRRVTSGSRSPYQVWDKLSTGWSGRVIEAGQDDKATFMSVIR
jgi:hypothetical protein